MRYSLNMQKITLKKLKRGEIVKPAFNYIIDRLNEIFFFKICKSQPCIWGLSEYSQELRALPLTMTAQILVVFEITFFVIFQRIFKKSKLIFFPNFKFLTL